MQLQDQIDTSAEPSDSAGTQGANLTVQAAEVWSREQWRDIEAEARAAIVAAMDDETALRISSRLGRRVLRSYSSSFYAVTRFLPRAKRADVEMVYAAVRYPDEIVDTFDLAATHKQEMLDEWLRLFRKSARIRNIRDAVASGIPAPVAGFRDVIRRNEIPEAYYIDFIEAMRRDITPHRFDDWNDLIENYVYGSATVVGFFLAHIYGAADGRTMGECLRGARSLAIALQLTNFARDASDDAARSRCYLPVDQADARGNSLSPAVLGGESVAITEAKLRLAEQAAVWFRRAEKDVGAFNPDSRVAIDSCQRLYSALNTRILRNASAFERESLSFWTKLSVLPRSKYWRLPAAMLLER